MIMKLYEIKLFDLYNIKIFHDIREHLLDNHLVLGFNFCNSESCDESTYTHYSAFLIFSYPNSTNVYLDINEYLNNNIFGYIFKTINIFNLIGCDDLILKSRLNSQTINKGYNLSENELIKIEFKQEKKSFNCSIYYRYIITEPEFSKHVNYYVKNISTNFTYQQYLSIYNSHKSEYLGKISIYNLFYEYIKPPTTIIYPEKQTTIITVPAVYTTENIKAVETIKTTEYIEEKKITSIPIKMIPTTQQITEKITELITERITEKITELITERITEQTTMQIPELKTELITEIITERITNMITELNSEKTIEYITDKVTSVNTEQITKQIIQQITNKIPEQITEQLTQEITEQSNEQISEMITERSKQIID